MTTALLEVRAVHAGHGAAEVLFGIDLAVAPGEIVGVLGRNGMGKTTLVRTIMGLLRPRAGTIALAGRDITGWAPNRIARARRRPRSRGTPGVSQPQRRRAPRCVPARIAPGRVRLDAGARARSLSGLAARRSHGGNQLSGGEQQMLAIGRALVTNPALLILDEATEGLAPLVREEIWRALRQLRDAGLAMIVIDKYVQRLVAIGDHHVIIEKGRVVWRGSSIELDGDRALWHRYLGA